MFISVCVGFLVGVVSILLIEVLIFRMWFSRQHQIKPEVTNEFVPDWAFITEILKDINCGTDINSDIKGKETSCFLNSIFLFLFQELREDTKVRAQVLSRINNEITEVLNTKLKSKLIKSLSVHNFSAGTSPPKISNLHISKLKLCEESKNFRKLHLSVNIDYRGCGKLALQATTFLGKNMYISVEVTKLIGNLIFIFNRNPQTHWGFCFETEPEIEFNVISAFQQRRLPQLTRVITSILKHTIRKKHTKPNYKKRYTPLFKVPMVVPTDGQQLLICKEPLTKGKLVIKLVSANRVVRTSLNANRQESFYCTLSLGAKPWDTDCCPLKQTMVFDTNIPDTAEGMGIAFSVEKSSSDHTKVVVDDIHRNSPAAENNVKQGDVITAINHRKVLNFRNVLQASINSQRARLSLRRPLIKLNKMFTSGEASQDMAGFQADSINNATFVEDEEFLILEHEELEREGDSEPAELNTSRKEIDDCKLTCKNTNECVLRSQLCPASIAPFWDEYFLFQMLDHHQYLTVCLWKENPPSKLSSSSPNPILIGYCSASLADIILQCISTTSQSYNDSLNLSLPTDVKWQDNIVPPLGSLPGTLPKLLCIAGEVKIQLTYCSEDQTESCPHSFTTAQVQSNSVCSLCAKRLIHRAAFMCVLCGVAQHEDCLGQFPRRHTGSTPNKMCSERKRAQTLDPPGSRDPSFSFLMGSEKKAAVLSDKIQDVEQRLKEKISQRKSFLGTKAKCQQVPVLLQNQLNENAETIKHLINLKEQMDGVKS